MVSDLEESRSFYADVLGLEPEHAGGEHTEFLTAGGTLVLEEDFAGEILNQFGLRPPGEDRGTGVMTGFEVSEPDAVDEIHRRATNGDTTVRLPPQEVPWGRYVTFLGDPDGYTIEVYTSLADGE
jgi:catechol 2,3-dioxygenase-like lactoylglutathione lyase family enzyme